MTVQDYLKIIGLTTAIVAALAFVLAYFVVSFRKNKQEGTKDVISSAEQITRFWKERADDYSKVIETMKIEYDAKIQDLTRKLGELTGRFEAEKTQNERLEKIFQGRSPELENSLKDISSTMNEIMVFMHSINEHMKTSNKDLKIEAVVSHDNK